MNIITRKYAAWSCALLTGGLLSFAGPASAQTGGNKTFVGNGNGGFGGTIGNGSMVLTDDTTNIYGTITTGGNFNDCLVLYVQTTNGGFTSTSGFTDTSDGSRHAIADPESPMTFLSGFAPNFGIALGPNDNNFGGLWALTNGGTFPFIASVNLTPTGTSTAGTYTFTVPLVDIGLPVGSAVVGTTIKLFGTYTANSGYRSTEAIAGNDTGTQGTTPFTQTAFGTYLIGELPTVSFPITFQVDLTAVLANGNFNPGNGDKVEVRGSFNSGAGGVFLAPESNTNLYSVTYNTADAVGTPETFLYDILHTNPVLSTNFEATDARTFVLASSQTLPVIYFSDLAATTHSTVPLTFSVNMRVAIGSGKFNPGEGDQVFAYGDFNQDANYTWLGNLLTVSGTDTNVYSGTANDGNYTGTPAQYKFVIVTSSGVTNFESRPNRTYTTPATAETFPTVFFNDLSNLDLVTFQVDLSAAILGGKFTPGIDTATVAGTFDSSGFNTTQFPLTNNASGTNTHIYSGVIPVTDAAGSTQQYKFTYAGPGVPGTVYENPSASTPTIGGNRFFVVSNAVSQVLPLVFFSDQSASDLLAVDTEVTFSVNMTNAVGTDAVVFSVGDGVYINGDFLTGGFNTWNEFLPELTQATNGSLIYTITQDFPVGSPIVVTYKYGINGVDDEAGFAQNHVRYIRHTGTYTMPLDVFGQQLVEPSFGNLKIGQPTAGVVPITWLGRQGVHLQVRSSLTTGSWVDHPETDGLSSTNWPFTGSSLFFRLTQPNP